MKTSASCGRQSSPLWTARLCLALVPLLLGSASGVAAQAVTLEGVWGVTITPRNCTTNEPLPLPPHRTILTFHRDGTTTESVGVLTFAPGQRAIGHGIWAHAGGQIFNERTVAMILFDAGIYRAGWQVISRTITMTDANNYTGFGPSQFFDANRQMYLAGCASSVGVRFQ